MWKLSWVIVQKALLQSFSLTCGNPNATSQNLMSIIFFVLNLRKSWNLGPLYCSLCSLLFLFLPLKPPPKVLGPQQLLASGAHESGANIEVWCFLWNVSIHWICSSVYSSICTPPRITWWVSSPLRARRDDCLVSLSVILNAPPRPWPRLASGQHSPGGLFLSFLLLFYPTLLLQLKFRILLLPLSCHLHEFGGGKP